MDKVIDPTCPYFSDIQRDVTLKNCLCQSGIHHQKFKNIKRKILKCKANIPLTDIDFTCPYFGHTTACQTEKFLVVLFNLKI
jgi:hypothetical protein